MTEELNMNVGDRVRVIKLVNNREETAKVGVISGLTSVGAYIYDPKEKPDQPDEFTEWFPFNSKLSWIVKDGKQKKKI